jgi:hypothetical protein
MALNQMTVFNEYIMPATIETLGQMVEKFNASSAGAIRLTTEGFTGDFMQESFFAAIHSAQRRVNRYGANGAATPTDLTQLRVSAVKVAGGFGPVRFEPSQMTWLSKPTAEGIEVASRNFAEAMLRDQLNTAIAALVAAIGNQADLTTNDVSLTAGINYGVLNGAHARFGDRSGDIVANVMDGATYHRLVGQNLANAVNLFNAQGVTIVDILGKSVIVTDAPGLFLAGTPDRNRVLGLASGAATVMDAGDVVSNIDTVNGRERIETTMQVDYSFGLSMKGYSWNEATGGKSPTDAALATGANWTRIATDIKQTAGVLAVGDPALA